MAQWLQRIIIDVKISNQVAYILKLFNQLEVRFKPGWLKVTKQKNE